MGRKPPPPSDKVVGSGPASRSLNGIFWDIMGYYGRQWKALASARFAGLTD
jgi:hypothetical protein